MVVPLLLLYLTIVLSPPLLALATGKHGKDSFIYESGLSVALAGLGALAMQFVLAARLKWLERPYGLDMVYGFHRAMGTFVGLLLLAHPVLLAVGRPHHWSFLFGLSARWYIWVGRGALLALVVLAALAVFRVALRLDYQRWQAGHSALSFLLLVGALVHVWYAGGDSKLVAMKSLWLVLGGAASLAFLWQRFRALVRLRYPPFIVTEVRQEAKGIWTVSLAPQPGTALPDYLPGQYQYLTLCPAGASKEEHPFTLSSSPTRDGVISSTIKVSGDWTAAIERVRPGDAALVDAPFGRFSHLLHPGEGRLVFIAGGVGITPLISMLASCATPGPRRTSCYSTPTAPRRTSPSVKNSPTWKALRHLGWR